MIMSRLPIRIRLVIMTMFILTLCCVGLTLIINKSATQMASQVAEVVTPAQSIDDKNETDTPTEYAMNTTMAENKHQTILDSFYQNSAIYMLVVVLIGGISMYFFSKRILSPLTDLNQKIKTSSITNLSDKMEVPSSDDEITELAVSFNKMTDRLHEAFIFQQRFSANVAHELRTPLTILNTKIDVFNKKEQRSLMEHKQLILDLKNQVIRLSDIVQNLLNLTTTDKIQEKQYFALEDMIEDILQELSKVSSEKNIHISTSLQGIEVFANIDLLYQVFYNLIQNSIHYNVEHGSIYITAEKLKEHTMIQVCDTGIGIPKDKQQHIFEPFYRVDKSRSRLIGGSGLGLSIVKHIIEKHSGTIHVMDYEPQGTCFIIELPFL